MPLSNLVTPVETAPPAPTVSPTSRFPEISPPSVDSLLSNAVLTALFCTGFSDAASSAASTVILFAPASTPSSFVLSAADIRPAAPVVASAVLALLSNAALIALFWTGFVLDASSAASTTVLFAPASTPSSLALSSLDIRPSRVLVAGSVTSLSISKRRAIMPFSTAFWDSVSSASSTGKMDSLVRSA